MIERTARLPAASVTDEDWEIMFHRIFRRRQAAYELAWHELQTMRAGDRKDADTYHALAQWKKENGA